MHPGLPRPRPTAYLVVAIVGNIDMWHHMLEARPWLRQVLHERAFTADDVESELSTTAGGLHHKEEAGQACGSLRGR